MRTQLSVWLNDGGGNREQKQRGVYMICWSRAMKKRAIRKPTRGYSITIA